MANRNPFRSTLRDHRLLKGWSQDELARFAGLSRAGVGAIETGRLVPSVAAALALAAALECTVEDLFQPPRNEDESPPWAWPPRREPCRYWRVEVGGKTRWYPVETTAAGLIAHDGVSAPGAATREKERPPRPDGRTLLVAGCDPAAGLLAAALARDAGIRLIVLPRSSRAALALLARGVIHVAGVHLAGANAGDGDGNARIVRETLGAGHGLIRLARWEEGIAVAPSARTSSIGAVVRSRLRWIGREPGSGARLCQDELLEGRRPPRRQASDHRGVAQAVRNGWADAGVCLQLVSEEAGLDFLPVRGEDYDLCYPSRLESDPRLQTLLRVLRSPSYRMALGELPGYDSRQTGELQHVD